jgi:3-hydroxybutyryl-CoA dehydrogenase
MQDKSIKLDPVGVIGLGLLGRGITASLLSAGFCVVAFDEQQEACEQARAYIEDAILELTQHNCISLEFASSWPERYSLGSSIDSFKECAFIIESVSEAIAVKRQVYDEIEAIVGSEVPIASNTSAVPVKILQHGRRNPARFLGMHWSEPAYATRFMEIIRGEHTSEETLQAAMELGRRTGKDPCIVNQDIPGFIGNRLGYALYREALHLLEVGAGDVDTIDRAFRNGCGLWATLCGPFRWIDITGGPKAYADAMTGVLSTLSASPELPQLLIEKQGNGERGTINGRGFYTYGPEDVERWQKLLHEHAWEIRRLQEHYYPLSEPCEEK